MQQAVIVALLLTLGACAQPTAPPPATDLKAKIDANNAAWDAAANKGDAASVAAMYTDNATMLPPGMPMQVGRAAIQKTVEGLGRSGVRNISLEAIDVAQLGPDTAREIGGFSLQAPAPRKTWATVEGKYVVIWKLVGGQWMLDTDIWNMNR